VERLGSFQVLIDVSQLRLINLIGRPNILNNMPVSSVPKLSFVVLQWHIGVFSSNKKLNNILLFFKK
jgi:hypothetical protein